MNDCNDLDNLPDLISNISIDEVNIENNDMAQAQVDLQLLKHVEHFCEFL